MKTLKNSHVSHLSILVFWLCSWISIPGAADITLYVSPDGNDSWAGDSLDKPFATIYKARDAIRAIKEKGPLTSPVTVYIRGGTYELPATLVFTLEDSGTKTCPITYTAYRDEKPVISGGRGIDASWKKHEGEIMVCTVPEVREGNWRFRQLFLNGERQTRARIPNLDESFIKGDKLFQIDQSEEDLGRDAMKYRPGHFKQYKNLNDVEVVLYRTWNESRLLVSELYEDERVVTFTGPIGRRLGSGNRYYIDNALEELDQPGEWYLDRHTGELYYWPVQGAKLSELRAPVINELVRFEGDVVGKTHVQYINIRGLTFIDADYILPKEGIPPIRDPGDIWFPSAITLKGVSNCVFEDNTVRNVGTYGVDLTGDGNRIFGNKIYDTGSGGIITRSYGRHSNIISYNHIHHSGLVFHAGVGVNIDDGGGVIGNNLIHDISHSGIYVRHHTSDYGQGPERSNQEQGLIIEYNEIHDVMLGSNDGGGIFVRDHYITIRNNFIHDSRVSGIYLGCETRNTLVENNVLCRTGPGQVVWFLNKNITIFNNIYIDGNPPLWYANYGGGYHQNIRVLRNIVSFSDPAGFLINADEESFPLESDYNLVYHTTGKELLVRGLPDVQTFADWQNLGFDTHSVVADPLFVDPENDDYSLRPDSPALKMGFKPIDLSSVGLRGRK